MATRWVALFTDDAEYHEDPFDRAARRPATRSGHTLLDAAESQRDVEFTVERHWVSGTTVLAAWHASFVDRATGRRRPAGGLPDRRQSRRTAAVSRFREWTQLRAPRRG